MQPAIRAPSAGSGKDIGLLLPCNVVVYEEADGSVVVAAIRPSVAMQVTDSAALATIAQEVEERLERVIQGITADSEYW